MDRGTIAIVTDATADVPPVERERTPSTRWTTLPEVWHTPSGAEFLDDGSHSDSIVRLVLDAAGDAEPAAPGWDDFISAYEQLRAVDRVFSIHAPSSSSWAIETAREAAGAFPNVRVIEANVSGIGVGLLAACARDRAADGAEPDELERWLNAHRDAVRMLVVPDRLDPSSSQRGLSTRLLTGRPLMHSSVHGTMDRSRPFRSRRATVAAIERYFREHTTKDGNLVVALAHGGAAGAVDPLLDVLERIRPDAEIVLIGRVGPRMLQQTHARSVAAAWIELRELVDG